MQADAQIHLSDMAFRYNIRDQLHRLITFPTAH